MTLRADHPPKGSGIRASSNALICRGSCFGALRQQEEHAHAGNAWHEGGWVFATETGDPINPRTDWSHWKVLLQRAGIRDGRLHDARHTAATVLLMLGVSQTTMMSIMGWSNPAMAQRYAHVVAPIRDDVARQVEGLWPRLESPGTTNETRTETTTRNAGPSPEARTGVLQVTGGGGGI